MLTFSEYGNSLSASYFFYEILLVILFLIFGGIFFYYYKKPASKKKKLLLFLSFLILIVLSYGSFIEPKKLVITEKNLEIKTLPKMKIALISDLHVGPFKNEKWVEKVVKKINSLENIEVLFIAGDFIYGGEKFVAYLKPLEQLKVPVIFSILGNHDHHEDEPQNTILSNAVTNKLADLNIPELKNENFFWEEKGIWIFGMDDNYLQFHDFEKTFNHTDDQPKILLAHSPDIIDELASSSHKVDLVLFGHTHCGQVRFPSLGAFPYLIPTKNGKNLEKHWYQKKNTNLFITCGVGEVGT